MSSILYGPVPSWRLGRSLGVDLVAADEKTCSFDCIYCQLGRTVHRCIERKEFVTLNQLKHELLSLSDLEADYATLCGVGEPTLASNIVEAIEILRQTLTLPVALITNSSLLSREDVRRDLVTIDVVLAKLDAHNEEAFQMVNRPVTDCSFEMIINGIRLFREIYKGKLALQIMFVRQNMYYARQIADLARSLSPDEVQLNTPLRPCAEAPLSPDEMDGISVEFHGLNVIEVYHSLRPNVLPLNTVETARRRPMAP